MGLFKRANHDPDELARLRSEIATMRELLDRVEAERADLGNRVQTFTDRLTAPPAEPPPAPAHEPTGPAADHSAEIADLRAELAGIAEGLGTLDMRLTSSTTELANQLAEIGGDLDAIGSGHNGDVGGTVDPAALAELRDAQTRLANEQARYQIAFREDLAALAERLRRPGS